MDDRDQLAEKLDAAEAAVRDYRRLLHDTAGDLTGERFNQVTDLDVKHGHVFDEFPPFDYAPHTTTSTKRRAATTAHTGPNQNQNAATPPTEGEPVINIDDVFELDSADMEEDAPTVILHISGHPEFRDTIGTLIEEISSYAIRITNDPDADNKVLIKGAVTPVLYIGDAAFALHRWADLPPGDTANYVIGLIWGYLAGAEGSAAA